MTGNFFLIITVIHHLTTEGRSRTPWSRVPQLLELWCHEVPLGMTLRQQSPIGTSQQRFAVGQWGLHGVEAQSALRPHRRCSPTGAGWGLSRAAGSWRCPETCCPWGHPAWWGCGHALNWWCVVAFTGTGISSQKMTRFMHFLWLWKTSLLFKVSNQQITCYLI